MSFYTIFPIQLNNWAQFCFFKEIFSEDECNKIIALHKEPLKAKVGDGDGAVLGKIRSTEVSFFGWSQETSWIYDRLNQFIQAANQSRYDFQISGIMENIQITRYRPGDFYGYHLDNGPGVQSLRKISLVIQLSDPKDYTGGMLEFAGDHDKDKVPTGQGDLIVFPSYVAHRVTPLESGERWSLVVWVSGEPYR